MTVDPARQVQREGLLLGVALFLAMAAVNVLTPLLPLVQRDFGIDYATAGLLVSAFGLARLALDLPGGFLEQLLGGPRLGAAGYLLLGIGAVVTAVGPSFEVVLAGRVCMGLGCSIISIVVLTALSHLAPPAMRTRILTNFAMANNTAISVFPVVGGLLGQFAGWRSTMWLCLVLGAFSALLLFRRLARLAAAPQAEGGSPADQGGRFVLNRWVLLALLTLYFGMFVNMFNRHGFRNTTLPLFAADQLGLNAIAIASGISLMSIVGLAVSYPGGILADRWSRRGVIVAGFTLLALGDLFFLGVDSYPMFLLAAMVLGLGDFFSASQTAALTEMVPARWRSRALGAYRFMVDLGAAAGPVSLATLLQVGGYQTAVYAAAGLLLLAAVGSLAGALVPARATHPAERPATAR